MKRIIHLIILLSLAVAVSAQVQVKGRVINLQNKPVSDVIVKLMMGSEVNNLPMTVISREYPQAYLPGSEAYYPVNDNSNSRLYAQYQALAEQEEHVIFGGRLAEYKYYDMDDTIARAMACWDDNKKIATKP